MQTREQSLPAHAGVSAGKQTHEQNKKGGEQGHERRSRGGNLARNRSYTQKQGSKAKSKISDTKRVAKPRKSAGVETRASDMRGACEALF